MIKTHLIKGMKPWKTILSTTFFLLVFLFLLMSPDSREQEENAVEVKAKVISIDNSEVIKAGVSAVGQQIMRVVLLDGPHKNNNVEAVNLLVGNLEYDSFYSEEDIILVGLKEENGYLQVKASEPYRQPYVLLLCIFFVLCLIGYAGIIGVKALMSFLLTILCIWKLYIPLLLGGYNPIIVTIIVVILLSAIIIFAITGWTRKGTAAFIGVSIGLIITFILTLIFGHLLKLSGMTAPYAETIVFSGYFHLNMQQLFYGAIIIGSSGAAMDIAMDVSSSCWEIRDKCPDIQYKELCHSGFNVGKDVLGTMTTTLLLAYSGGYLTLIMLFYIRDASLHKIINMQIVAAELMRTLVGSIGLIIVAPTTAILAAFLMTKRECKRGND